MTPRFLRTVPVVLALALLPAARAAAQPDVVNITRRASPAVITLNTYNASGRQTGLGSGFFLPDGRIATNRHVVEGSSRVEAVTQDERRLGTATYAEAVGGATADLAILPLITNPPATLPLARGLPEVGEAIVVIGAPEGLSNTVSTGIVSAIRRVEGKTLVQISAPISHGSSGGPVLNMRGEVVGVSVAVLSEGQNLNFAVPVTELTRLTQSQPGRVAFTGDLRFGGERGSTRGRDVDALNPGSLPRITVGQTVEGRLTTNDFRRPDGSFADTYVYTGRAGEQITVTMRSSAFDSWLVMADPSGSLAEHDDDSGGNLDSQLTVTLPRSGQYLIVANSISEGSTGAYTLTVERGGGRVSSNDGNNNGNNGGGGEGDLEDLDLGRAQRITLGQTVNGTISRNDFLRSDNTYADPYIYYGRAGEQITVTMRSRAFDSWLVLMEPGGNGLDLHDDDGGGGNDSRLTVTLPRTGRYLIAANTVGQRDVGAYTLTVERGAGSARPGGSTGRGVSITGLDWRRLPAIRAGAAVSGRLTAADMLRDDNSYMDGYVYTGRAGERITITLQSGDFDAWLVVNDPNGPMYEHDDDSLGGTDAQLTLTLPHAGPYVIVANSVGERATGAYVLRVQTARSDRTIERINP